MTWKRGPTSRTLLKEREWGGGEEKVNLNATEEEQKIKVQERNHPAAEEKIEGTPFERDWKETRT